jgi:Uma2 family endonuclease
VDEFEGDYLLTDSPWEELLWVWRRTDIPKGCKSEIIDGVVTVTPYSGVAHHDVSEPLQRQLHDVIPRSWGIYQRLALALPSRLELYVPDLAVVPEEALRGPGDDPVRAGAAELIVEITSAATARADRVTKPAGCADAGVPLYLLIDRLAAGGPAVTLYGDPHGGTYRVLTSVPCGAPVELPPPFGLTLAVG